MQNNEYVYFLSVKQAVEIEARHQYDEEWELWQDSEARTKGLINKYFSDENRKERSAS